MYCLFGRGFESLQLHLLKQLFVNQYLMVLRVVFIVKNSKKEALLLVYLKKYELRGKNTRPQ